MVAIAPPTLVSEILRLKKERNADILALNYHSNIQIADFLGNSLGLDYKAKETDADVIALFGVYFIAETAKICVEMSETVHSRAEKPILRMLELSK